MGIVRIQPVNHVMFLGLSENGAYLKFCNFGNDDQSSIVHKVPYWQATPREYLVKDGLLTME